MSVMPAWKHHKLIFAGSVMMAYEYDKNTYPNQIDEYVPIATLFHPNFQEFITPVNDSIKVWNALDGKLK